MAPGAFLITLAAAVVSLAFARRLAIRIGVVAQPNPVVSDHVSPVALLGGTAAYMVFLVFSMIHLALADARTTSVESALVVGAAGLIALGTFDDCRALQPGAKLLCQLAICLPVVAVTGGYDGVEIAGAAAFVVLVVNAYNLVDVMDGLLCTLALPALVSFSLTPGLLSPALGAELWIATACLVALLAFNRPPARIYAGDAGSLTTGYLVGFVWLELLHREGAATAVPALLLLAIPFLEVILLVAARLRRGVSPLRPSRDHFSLRLREQGRWSRPRILLTCLGVSAVLCSAPLVSATAPGPVGAAFLTACVLGLIAVFRFCWRLEPPHR